MKYQFITYKSTNVVDLYDINPQFSRRELYHFKISTTTKNSFKNTISVLKSITNTKQTFTACCFDCSDLCAEFIVEKETLTLFKHVVLTAIRKMTKRAKVNI